jgi:hypothetical protein
VEGLIPSFIFIEITFCENEKEGSNIIIAENIKNRFKNSRFTNIILSFGCIRVIYRKSTDKQKEVGIQTFVYSKATNNLNSFFNFLL